MTIKAKNELVRFARLLHQHGYTAALDGNLSVRLSDGRLLATRSGCHKGLMTSDDVLLLDESGKKLQGDGEPTSEIAMHLACYAARDAVRAVIHAHPPHAIAATLVGVSLQAPILPEAVIALGAVPTLPYERTGTTDLADSVEGAIWGHPAVMLERHGSVTVGTSLLDAFCNLESLEHTAKILLLAHGVRQPDELPAAEVEALQRIGAVRRLL